MSDEQPNQRKRGNANSVPKSSITLDLIAAIEAEVLVGVPFGTAVEMHGIGRRSGYDWLTKGKATRGWTETADLYRQFANRIRTAKAQVKARRWKTMQSVSDDYENKDNWKAAKSMEDLDDRRVQRVKHDVDVKGQVDLTAPTLNIILSKDYLNSEPATGEEDEEE